MSTESNRICLSLPGFCMMTPCRFPRAKSKILQMLLVVIACFIALLLPLKVQAAVVSVTTTADSGAGSLRQAVSVATAGDTIDFSGLTLPATITLTSGEIAINKNLIIAGTGARNLTISGGGSSRIFNISTGVVTINGVTLSNGNAGAGLKGGAIYNSGNLTLNKVTVSNSSAPATVPPGSGGGIANYGTLTLLETTVSGNSANYAGGGIYNEAGIMVINNSTISGNSSSDGGGIYHYSGGSNLTLNNSTITYNSTGNPASAALDHYFGNQLAIYNTIIANNSGGIADLLIGSTPPNFLTYSLVGTVSGTLGTAVTTGTIYGPAILGPLGNNGGPTDTHALLPGSTAIDAGVTCLPYDQRGVVRPQGAKCDIGAFEAISGQLGGAIQSGSVNLTSTNAGVATLAGLAGTSGSTNGVGTAALFNYPFHTTSDGSNIYIADRSNHTIRKMVIADGTVTTLAGTAGSTGSTDAVGTSARFNFPDGITTDGVYLYVADSGNNKIRRIDIAGGSVATLAGTGNSGALNGPALSATFNSPSGITTDGLSLFVAEALNHTIRRIDLNSGWVSTLAGSAGVSGSQNGTGANARFNAPQGITMDGVNLFVADYNNYTVRKIEIATATVSTLAGLAGTFGTTDGPGSSARFQQPVALVTDGTSLYVSDTFAHTIRRIDYTATPFVTTVAGSAGLSGSADGSAGSARFKAPYGITSDGTRLFVLDKDNFTVRIIGQPSLLVSPPALAFGSVGIGFSALQPLTITSTGDMPLLVSSYSLSDATYFGPIVPGKSNPCPTPPYTLASGASCTIDVTFHPTIPSPPGTSINIYSSAPASPVSVPLSGVGSHPCIWTAGVTGNWHTAANWTGNCTGASPPGAPGPADFVVIPASATPYSVNLDGNSLITAVKVGSQATLAIPANNLILTGPGSLVEAGGTLNLSGGILTIPVGLAVNGAFNWSGGTISGTGGLLGISAGATATISGPAVKNLNGATINSAAYIPVSGTGNLNLDNGAVFQNDGTLDLQSDAGLTIGAGGGTFNNNAGGVFEKSAGTGKSPVDTMFNSKGAVNIATGTLSLTGLAGFISGSVSGGGTLEFLGSAFVTPAVTYDNSVANGTTSIAGGTVAFDNVAQTGNFIFTSGNLNGNGSLNVKNSFTWDGGTVGDAGHPAFQLNLALGSTSSLAGAAPLLFSAGTIANAGTVTMTSAVNDLDIAAGATFQNNGSFDFQTDRGLSGTGTFNNNPGALIKKSAGASSSIAPPFVNTGTVDVQSGVINFSGTIALPAVALTISGTSQYGKIYSPIGSIISGTPITINLAYTPATGDTFTGVISCGTTSCLSGTFSSIIPATPGANQVWSPVYNSTSVDLKVIGNQTITFNNPGPQTFGMSPTLTASVSSGLTPTFTSTTTAVCAITAAGKLAFNGSGTCTIAVDQPGDPSYNPATQVSQSFTVNPALSISTITLPSGTTGIAYSQTIAPTGGTAPITFAISTGTIPTGLTLTTAGVLSGTPPATGTFTFDVVATDAVGATAIQSYTVNVTDSMVFTTTTLPASTINIPYSQTITATGGMSPLTYAVTAGSLPAGVSLSSSGLLTGTPTASGTFNFTVTATDTLLNTANQPLSIIINPAVAIIISTLPTGTVGIFYNQNIATSGGTAPTSISLMTGTIPTGLTLTTAGVLSGTPTSNGSFSFTVEALDSVGAIASQTYTVIIAPPVTYTVTSSVSGVGGSITPPSASVTSGGTTSFTVAPDPGYRVTSVSGCGGTWSGANPFVTGTITANCAVTAAFSLNSYTVTATAGGGGSISPAGSLTVNSGANQPYSITPNTGYHILDVKIDGISHGAIAAYSFTNVTADHTIDVRFAVNTYTVTANAGGGGSITPAGTVYLPYGAEQTYSFTPNTGYSIADVKVDGVSKGGVSSYTFTNVIADHTIDVRFAVNIYTINATADLGGSITPAGAVSLPFGSEQTYVFTPESGYFIDTVKIDNQSVGMVTSYTFTNLRAYHTITVEFARPDGVIDPTNRTGIPNIGDALIALTIAMGDITPTPHQLKHADVAPLVNGVPKPDGIIDIRDVLLTLRRVVGLEK